MNQSPRFEKQLEFILTADRLKEIVRRNYLADGSRRETVAEHSWHLALMVLVFSEYSNEPLDVSRTVMMVLLHDLIEIEAGDTFAYDAAGYEDKSEREQKAAQHLFGLLPEDQAEEFRKIWDEFEAAQTPEAKFSNALDRLLPLLQNHSSGGSSWLGNQITRDQVMNRNLPVQQGSETLFELAKCLIEDSISKGYLKP